ncbi:MAG TPA: MarR family transcriptional regulator [Candidatus Dormibacteraeota bacterium]|nr:MarR family transcriptional regulator [Candidatus Dormibacteraeota bacterium]
MDAEAVIAEVRLLYPAVLRRFQASRQRIPGSDVTPRMLGLLRLLSVAGPLSVGDQARHMGLSRATATELVDRLESKGLAARIRDGKDRRRVFVSLTEAGRERAAAHPEVIACDEMLRAVELMSPVDRRSLIVGLRALLAAADETATGEAREAG